jgi:hypothetical protein
VVVRPAPGGGYTVRACLGHLKFISSKKQFSKVFNDSNLETTQKSLWTKGEEWWCALRILTRIRNLSKVATID